MYSYWDHFGNRTAWSLLYFLNYTYYDIYLAQSQILVTTLYVWLVFQSKSAYELKQGQFSLFLAKVPLCDILNFFSLGGKYLDSFLAYFLEDRKTVGIKPPLPKHKIAKKKLNR